jgi:ABC-type Fe3+ transport system substrate-binding protein
MFKNVSILVLLVAIISLPFLLRRSESAATWHSGDPVLVIVTPHNEAIRYEFERGFSKWHQAKYGSPVKIEWRAIGGTTEIMRFLASEYASSARAWWTRSLNKSWPLNGTEIVVGSSPPARAEQLELFKRFRETDDPKAFSCRIDLFFGGGQFDHEQAFRQGMNVAPWKAGSEPEALFYWDGDSRIPLIPEKVSGEIWRTPYLFGNVISTFGICYNVDRLADLRVAKAPVRWVDLANPVYIGQVGVADPTKSGSVAKAFELMIHQRMHDTVRAAGYSDSQIDGFEKQISDEMKKKGKAYHRGEIPPGVPAAYQEAVEKGWIDGLHLVQRIGANARYFTDSASKVPIDVSVGDAAVGMAIDFYGRYQAQESRAPDGHDRMIYLTPVGGSSVSCDPISLLRGAEHREIAVRFIEYTLSEAGQKLWCYKPGLPKSAGGPEKYALRRLPIRRDFYPSTSPAMQKRFAEHQQYAVDKLGDPAVDPYQLAKQFTYYPRWTGSHFGFHRDLIRIMCMDAGDELKEAWRIIKEHGGPGRQGAAMKILGELPPEVNWRDAPDIFKKGDKMEIGRRWTRFFRENYRKAEAEAQTRK